MERNTTLKELIGRLQRAIAKGEFNQATVSNAVSDLAVLGYTYDQERFPPLVDTETYTDTSGDSPSNLAEALLWKLGKWKSYKKFAANYAAQTSTPSKTDVVFFAFARHLQDKNNPIYDQHAIRALWAICGNFTDAEKSSCRSLLFDGKGKWKSAGSGSETIACYDIFIKHMNILACSNEGASLGEIDRLLMPLGQALKTSTQSYAEFQALCQTAVIQ